MNIIDYELIEDVSILFSSKILLYGTGYWADKTYNCLKEAGICPEVVFQTQITQNYFYDLKVTSLLNVINRFDNEEYLIIIASLDYYKEMVELCISLKKIKICTLYGFYVSIKMNIDKHILPREFEKKIEAVNFISQGRILPKLHLSAINRFIQAALMPEEYIWIFQPGKVGSQSIWNSIQDKSLQFHTLTSAYRFSGGEKKYLNEYLQLIRKKKIKIISSVREPISRDIAAFFQNSELELWPFNSFNHNIYLLNGDIKSSERYIDLKEIRERCPQWMGSLNKSFEQFVHAIMHFKMDLFSWFDIELKQIFGIDIYEYPFEKKKGYTIIEQGNVQILIVKMEYLSKLEHIIGDFIGDEKYKLINKNKASDKMYCYAYEGFKANIKIPLDYFEFYYHDNLKYEHFYSKDEIDNSFKHWEKYICKH